MEISVILPHIEALIFASEKPLTSLELTELTNNALGFLDDKISLDQVEAAVLGVIEKYDADFYPFEIKESGGGWQFLTKKEYHKTVAQLNGDKFLKRLSAASLETLAIIAYKQPITKGEIESIRGVNSDYSIQKLLEKELIIITGRNEEMPGKPLVYTTSKTFMDYFGINSPDELPVIKEILSSQPFAATPVPTPGEGLFKDSPIDEEAPLIAEELTSDDEEPLVVRGNGEMIEEPEVVVDDLTEVVEPEQVVGEASLDHLIETADEENLEEEEEMSEEAFWEESIPEKQDEVEEDIDTSNENETASDEQDATGTDPEPTDENKRP